MMRTTYLLAILLTLSITACGGPSAPDSPDPSTYGLTHEGDVPDDRQELQEKPQDTGGGY